MTRHQRMLFKPKANQQRLRPKRRKCGRDRCKETMDTRRIEQIKTTGHKQKHINTRTRAYVQYTHTTAPPKKDTIARIHVQTRGREEEQPKTKHHWQTACFCRPPPPEEHATNPIKNTPNLWGTLGTPLPHIQSPAPGLAWPEFLHWCPPACRGPTDAKWWWLIDGERTDTWQRPRSRVEMNEWNMGVSCGRIWRCRQRGQRNRKERGDSRDRGGGGEEEEREGRINKGRCCFFVSLPCLWRTYVSWCWRPGWYWWT